MWEVIFFFVGCVVGATGFMLFNSMREHKKQMMTKQAKVRKPRGPNKPKKVPDVAAQTSQQLHPQADPHSYATLGGNGAYPGVNMKGDGPHES